MKSESDNFEKWAEDVLDKNTQGRDDGAGFKYFYVQNEWLAWQARASLPSAQPSDVVLEAIASEHDIEVGDDIAPFGRFAVNKTALQKAFEKVMSQPVSDWPKAIEPLVSPAALTTQQAQSGDVERLISALKTAAVKIEKLNAYLITFAGQEGIDMQESVGFINHALQPFTQNK